MRWVALLSDTSDLPAHAWVQCNSPPFGEYDDEVLQVAGSRGQSGKFLPALALVCLLISPDALVVIWDFDSGDSTGASVGNVLVLDTIRETDFIAFI